MKMTVVLDERGQIVAVQQGAIQNPGATRAATLPRGVSAYGGLIAGPHQRLEEREVPDRLGSLEGIEKLSIEDIEKRAEEIRAHLTS
jgi:hypothetical protein